MRGTVQGAPHSTPSPGIFTCRCAPGSMALLGESNLEVGDGAWDPRVGRSRPGTGTLASGPGKATGRRIPRAWAAWTGRRTAGTDSAACRPPPAPPGYRHQVGPPTAPKPMVLQNGKGQAGWERHIGTWTKGHFARGLSGSTIGRTLFLARGRPGFDPACIIPEGSPSPLGECQE